MIADYFAPFLLKISHSFRNLLLYKTIGLGRKTPKYTLKEILRFKLFNIIFIT